MLWRLPGFLAGYSAIAACLCSSSPQCVHSRQFETWMTWNALHVLPSIEPSTPSGSTTLDKLQHRTPHCSVSSNIEALTLSYVNTTSPTHSSNGRQSSPCLPKGLGHAVGGNHEAMNYLWELYYGGWVAPNIMYLGHAGVVKFGGVRIGGLTGIFNASHYKQVCACPASVDCLLPSVEISNRRSPDVNKHQTWSP